MGEVIEVNFTNIKEKSGYILDGEKIKGVYHTDLAAAIGDDICYIGRRGETQIYRPVEISPKDLNEFCLMWLLIFNPSVINVEGD